MSKSTEWTRPILIVKTDQANLCVNLRLEVEHHCCHSCCQETPTTKLELFLKKYRNISGDDNISKMSIHTIGLKYLAFVAIASIYWTQTSWLTLVISLISLGWLVHNITKSQKIEGAENWSAIISKLCLYIFWNF